METNLPEVSPPNFRRESLTKIFILIFLFLLVSGLYFVVDTGGMWWLLFFMRINTYFQCVLVAVILSVSGRILQTLMLNPLAEPYLLGVSSGASLGAVLSVFLALTPVFLFRSLFSLIGAMGVAFLILNISKTRAGFSMNLSILAGIGLNALFGALIMLLQSILRPNALQTSIRWLMGSIDIRGPLELVFLSVGTSIILVFYFFYHKELDISLGGEEEALAVGVDTVILKRRAFIAVSLATATAVSITGVIGFVGLIVPHMARMLFGYQHKNALLPMFLIGSIVMLTAGLLSRVLVQGTLMPIGVLTSLIGAPFFIFLLIRFYRHQSY